MLKLKSVVVVALFLSMAVRSVAASPIQSWETRPAQHSAASEWSNQPNVLPTYLVEVLEAFVGSSSKVEFVFNWIEIERASGNLWKWFQEMVTQLQAAFAASQDCGCGTI